MAQIQRNQPLYEQLMWRIKAQVASGVLIIGEKITFGKRDGFN
jgi:GntR family transcriptional regulator